MCHHYNVVSVNAPYPVVKSTPQTSDDSTTVSQRLQTSSNRNDFFVNSTSTVGPKINNYQPLCGVPGVCKASAALNCRNITLSNCQDCSSTGTGFFLFFAVCFALAILFANSLIVSVSLYLTRKRKATTLDGYKASLALANMIMGFLILFVTLPNFAWAANLTFDEIQPEQVLLSNSAASIVGSTLYLLSFTSSLYHLVLLGLTRLYAIKWRYQYGKLSKRNFLVGIIVVWILAATVSSVPAWFPDLFDYAYYHTVFLYLPSITVTAGPQPFLVTAVAVLILLTVVPYILMTAILVATAVLVRIQVQHNRKRVAVQGDSSTITKREIYIFKMVAIMQVGFTLTLVPLAVTVGIFTSGLITCNDLSTPYLVCFYLSMTNSLVNVLVYSFGDKNFRKAIRDMLKNWQTAFCQKDVL